MISNKIAILDVDGTLLNWHVKFDEMMAKLGHAVINDRVYALSERYDGNLKEEQVMEYILQFNDSDAIESLPMNQYARAYVDDLVEMGYQPIWVSCYYKGEHDVPHRRRSKNIMDVFGSSISHGHSYPLHHTKSDVIRFYVGAPHVRDIIFVDDSPRYLGEAMDIALEHDKLTVVAWDQPYNQGVNTHERVSMNSFIADD